MEGTLLILAIGFFESRNDPKKDPVVLWLNGGPGCSSFLGLFEAHGPSKLPNPDLKPVRNPYSWNNNASVIYIDQPVNTGFSYSKSNVDTSLAAAKDLASLLTLFFTKFPEYSTQDFHISGQSYAGHWIPSTGSEIVTKNYTKINLKSLLIGNGLSDPLSQYKHYRPMACGEGGQKSVLSDSDCKSMDRGLPDCEKQIKSCYDGGGTSACRNATTNCNNLIFPTYNKSGRSHYDIRIKSGGEPATYAVDFMNKQSTKEALGVEVSRKYQKCSTSVYNSILGSGDWMQPRHRLLPDILAKIPVLYYSGDVDFICNWLGNQALTENLKWPGQSGFNSAKLQGLTLDGKEYGKVKHHQKFAFIRIYEAGHSVALNQPRPALDMLNRWLRGEWQS